MHVFEDREHSAVCISARAAFASPLELHRSHQVDDLHGVEEGQHYPLVRFEYLMLGQRRQQRVELHPRKKKKAHYSHTDESVPLLRPDLLLSVSVDCFVGEIQPTPLTTYNWSGQVRSLKIGRLSNKTASQHELYSLT